MNIIGTNKNLGGFLFSALLTSLLVMSLVSCEHKELLVPNTELSQVQVGFDYSDVEQTPKAMRVLFFPMESNRPSYKFDLASEGGYVRLPAGNYQVIAYNIDTENILEISDDDYDNFELTTQSYVVEEESNSEKQETTISYSRSLFGVSVPKGRGEGEFLLYDTPEWTCMSKMDQFQVKSGPSTPLVKTRAVSDNALTLHASTAVCVVDLVVVGIEGVEYASMVRGTLSGIAAGKYLASNNPTSCAGMVSFTGNIDRENKVIRARFFVWDFVPADSPDMRQYMNLYIWSNTGNYYMSADVTDVLANAEQAQVTHVDVRLKLELTIMEVDEGNSGFKPQLNEWEEQSSDIQL